MNPVNLALHCPACGVYLNEEYPVAYWMDRDYRCHACGEDQAHLYCVGCGAHAPLDTRLYCGRSCGAKAGRARTNRKKNGHALMPVQKSSIPHAPNSAYDNFTIEDWWAFLRAHLDNQTAIIENQETMITLLKSLSSVTPPTTPQNTPKRDIQAPAMPELEIKQAKQDDNNRSDWNFHISTATAVLQSVDSLPMEVLEYGLKKQLFGKLTKAAQDRVNDLQVNTIKEISGANVEFEIPDYDDLEI